MKKTLISIFAITVFMLFSCKEKAKVTPEYDKGINVIPMPASLTEGQGVFSLNENSHLVASSEQEKVIANFFAEKIRQSTGFKILVVEKSQGNGDIILAVKSDLDSNDEGYTLSATEKNVTINGKTPQGLFYGMQTLMQLLPAEIESTKKVDSVHWSIPTVEIKDQPTFAYRGMLIDVCRHFLTVDQLKKHIDVLSLFKINRLHLHLTDDQGWRIEIKKYPKLTEVGSKRIDADGSEYSGFYTQEEIKDIVKYASDRFISVIPEIEMPGHAMAAISAYPELATDPNKRHYTPRIIWGVEEDVYDASNEKVYQFISDIFDEIAPLFPSKYIHIGGDECPKISWKNSANCQAFMKKNNLKNEEELQSYFIKRAEKIAEEHGKYIIGWDEILEGGLPESATVMSWRGEEGGITASNQGHDVIMTPGSGGLYIDHYQGDPMVEPLAIFGYSPLEKTYSYDPIPKDIKPENRHHILGAQGNLWAEYLYTPEMYQYRAYPRILAIAELTWTPKEKKNFEDFSRRINNAYVRLDSHGINYHIPIPEQVNGSCDNIQFVDSTTLSLKTTRPMTIVYSLNDEKLSANSKVYTEPITIKENTVVHTASLLPSGKLSPERNITFTKTNYYPAQNVTDLVPGLEIKRAVGTYSSLKDLNQSDFYKAEAIDAIEQIVRNRNKNLDNMKDSQNAAIAEGYFNISEQGLYEFQTNYEQLFIDGKLVISNEGEVNKYSRKNIVLPLEKGLHSIKIVYFDIIRGGYPSYWDDGRVNYRLWGAEKKESLTPEMLFRKKSSAN